MRWKLLALALLAIVAGGCQSHCEKASVTLCNACEQRRLATLGSGAAATPADVGADPGRPPTPGAFDVASCVERTRLACEQHRSPPNCPY